MSASNHLPPQALDAWLAEASAALGLDPESASSDAEITDAAPIGGDFLNTNTIATVLNVARDVARGVARPAAPLSTFLLGLAVGRAIEAPAESATDQGVGPVADRAASLAHYARVITALAAEWQAEAGTVAD
jgi:hypothetical protein